MKIQIYGRGCPRCHDLARNAEIALRELGRDVQVQHVTDISKITEKGVMLTPALIIDDDIISEGSILAVEELKKIIESRSK